MNKILFACGLVALTCIASCHGSGDKASPEEVTASAKSDSLFADVMDGHDVGMAKMGKIRSLRTEIVRLLDSIATLPAKAREAAEPLKTRLNSAVADLNEAEAAMNNWMAEFDMDSAKNDVMKRVDYLLNEKSRVAKVKASILRSVEQADSILKSRF